MAETYRAMLETYGQFPQLAQPSPEGKVVDLHMIAEEMIRATGLKHVDMFFRDLPPQQQPMQVMPDQQVAQQVQAGNLMPM